MRLDFVANDNVTYTLSFRRRPQDPWTSAAFSLTPDGVADQTSLTTFAGDVSVYVERTTPGGFYAVGMTLSEL